MSMTRRKIVRDRYVDLTGQRTEHTYFLDCIVFCRVNSDADTVVRQCTFDYCDLIGDGWPPFIPCVANGVKAPQHEPEVTGASLRRQLRGRA